MKQIHKEYSRAFLLEPTKLTRIVDTIHQRLKDHPHTTIEDHFEVFLSGNRREELRCIDRVLALENSRRQKIERLLITCAARTEGSSRAEHEIQIDFACRKANTSSANENAKVVAVSVRSEDLAGWADHTLSEVEEQVERTWQRHVPSLLTLLVLLVGCLTFFVTQLAPPTGANLALGMWLRGPDLDRLELALSQNRTLSDQDIRDITTSQFRNLLEYQRPKQASQKGQIRQLLSIGIPLLVLLPCGLTLLFTCYPRSVFLWGDENERYANLLQRRKTLWGVIVTVGITGVASKLLFTGIDSWLPP